MNSITIRVSGLPVGQPRVRAAARGRHARVYDPGTANEWKACVIHAAREAMDRNCMFPFAGPVWVRVEFRIPRPKSHYRTGKRAGEIKPGMLSYHAQKPDLDNLLKSTLDALTSAGLWVDDSQIAHIDATKWWHDGAGGAVIEVGRLEV